MAISTEGGQGSVNGTIQTADAVQGTVANGTVSVFTTPATSNAIFRVFLSGIIITGAEGGGTSNTSDVAITFPGTTTGGSMVDDSSNAVTDASDDGTMHNLASELYVGPSTPINFSYYLRNPTAEQAEFSYEVAWHFLGTVIT